MSDSESRKQLLERLDRALLVRLERVRLERLDALAAMGRERALASDALLAEYRRQWEQVIEKRRK